jgi:hypothetical protein
MSTSQYETANWPASTQHLATAREFLSSISKKADDRPVLIIPDRDVDGLTSGAIIHRVLSRIILKNRNIPILTQFVPKEMSVHDPSQKEEIDSTGARYYLTQWQLI